jgi:hypothetical protein
MTIVLVANYAGLQELRTEYTFKTLNCGRNFKQCLLEFPYNECYSAFSTCMQDNTDFVFPAKMEVIEKTEQISSDVFTENEQNVNLKRCKRLNFYGKKIKFSFLIFYRFANMPRFLLKNARKRQNHLRRFVSTIDERPGRK